MARKAEVERSKCCALGSLMCRFITVKMVRDDTCQSVKTRSSQPTASSVRLVAQLFLLSHLSTSPQKPSRLFPSRLLPPIGLAFIQRRPTTRNSIHSSRNRGRGHQMKTAVVSFTSLHCAPTFFRRQKNVTFGPNQTVIDRPFPFASKFAHNSKKTDFFLSGVKRMRHMIRIFLCSPLVASDRTTKINQSIFKWPVVNHVLHVYK